METINPRLKKQARKNRADKHRRRHVQSLRRKRKSESRAAKRLQGKSSSSMYYYEFVPNKGFYPISTAYTTDSFTAGSCDFVVTCSTGTRRINGYL